MTPLEAIIDEMNGCVGAGLPLGAISLAVALPSICASLMMPDGRAQGDDYKDWCKDNLYPDKGFNQISTDELLSLRNGFVHQAHSKLMNNKKGKLEPVSDTARVVFILPRGFVSSVDSTIIAQDGIVSYAYNIDDFCNNMSSAALAWFEKNRTNPVVLENLKKMAAHRPFLGAPAIY